MKIAIPLDENKTDVCMVLARTPFFLFWEDGEQTIAENPAAQAQGGAGIQAAQFLVDSAAGPADYPALRTERRRGVHRRRYENFEIRKPSRSG